MNESSAPAFIPQSRVSPTRFVGEERSGQEENVWNAKCGNPSIFGARER